MSATSRVQPIKRQTQPPAKGPTNGKPTVRSTPTPKTTPRSSTSSPKETARRAATSSRLMSDLDPLANNSFYGTPPPTIFMYGPPKVGKTSMWMFSKDVGYIHDGNESVEQLVRFGQCPAPKWEAEVTTFERTLDLLADVADHKFGIRTLVVDSATGMELLCFQYHCREYFEDNWSSEGFYAFYKGPKNAAKKDWPRFLDALNQVKKSNIAVILLAHSQIKNDPNPFGDEYSKFIPYLDAEVWAQTHRWAEAILFYNIFVDVEKKKGGLKAKAKIGSEARHIYTQPEAVFAAGNRWGLESLIEAGMSPKEAYNAFVKEYLRAAKAGT